LGTRELNCHQPLLRAKSIAIGIAPRHHRYARARRWQFQIFAETWMKLSLSQPTEEDSCGGTYDILFLPTMRHESCGHGAATEMDFSFCSRLLPIRLHQRQHAVSCALPSIRAWQPCPPVSVSSTSTFSTLASTLRHGALSSHNPIIHKARSIGQYGIPGTPLPSKGFF
jgi:hypothetical protein